MPAFIGFSTIDQNKKFTLTDVALIKRDLANAFNIQQGEKPGRPGYGTTLWGFIFESQAPETIQAIITEIQRVAANDPRVFISNVQVYPQENGILIELQVQEVSSSSAERLSIFFDQQSRRATFI